MGTCTEVVPLSASSFGCAIAFITMLEAVEKAYPDAHKLAIKEGKLAKFGVRILQESEYPTVCPFSIDQILDEDFYGL
ncbi:DUF29 family protein [Nostoc sp.]|uniref:DUF29 family protein n=1 Tax=Nostoc sp. TaxID=1180 RepID=UPI003FA5CA42